MLTARKGLTLIEVVVALGILAIVFSSTMSLVVNVVKLSVLSREKTQIVSLAQYGLSRARSSTASNCSKDIKSLPAENITGTPYSVVITVTDKNYSEDTNSFSDFVSGGSELPDFKLIDSSVMQGGVVVYSIKELVKVGG